MIQATPTDRNSRVSARLGRYLPALRRLCREHRVVSLSVFGSVLRDDFGRRSDVDFVVEFEPAYSKPWYAHLTEFQEALESLLQRPVDVVERGALRNPFLIKEVGDTDISLFNAADVDQTDASTTEPLPMPDEFPVDERIRAALISVEEACSEIAAYAAGRTLSEYRGEAMLRDAIERKFITIGEAVNRVKKLTHDLDLGLSGIKSIIAFRNLIVHNYDLVDDEIVWDVVTKHVPKLHTEVKDLLQTKYRT